MRYDVQVTGRLFNVPVNAVPTLSGFSFATLAEAVAFIDGTPPEQFGELRLCADDGLSLPCSREGKRGIARDGAGWKSTVPQLVRHGSYSESP